MLSRVRLLLLALVAAALALLSVAGPAAAHDEIKSTSPKAGATVTTAPTSVVLTFGEDVVAVGTKVAVTTAGGVVVSDGDATVSGGTVTQPLQPLTENGTYTVAYRIVSADGHPVSDTFTFTLQAAAAASSASATAGAPSTSASAAGTATSMPAATSPPASTAAAAPPAESSTSGESGSSGAVWVAVLVAAVLGIGVVAWLLARRGPAGIDADDPGSGAARG